MKYRKAENCGPVPYPSDSTKLLTDEIVEGDEWEPLVALGFVVRLEEEPGKHFPDNDVKLKAKTKEAKPKVKPRSKKDKKQAPAAEFSENAKNDIVDTGENAGASDGINDRTGASGLDQASLGPSMAEDSANG